MAIFNSSFLMSAIKGTIADEDVESFWREMSPMVNRIMHFDVYRKSFKKREWEMEKE